MKTLKTLSVVSIFILILCVTQTTSAQVRIGGGISIDIGFPEVVVVDNPPRRVPTPAPAPRRRAPERRVYRSLGEVSNQFRGDNIVQQVLDVEVFENRRGVIDVKAYLQGGDVLSFTLENNNFNDVNYHFNTRDFRNRRGVNRNNRILEVRFNNNLLPIRDGHISLQPQGRNGYSAVLNIHNRMGDSFHGNFSTF